MNYFNNFFDFEYWEHLEDMTPKTWIKSLLPNQDADGNFSYYRNIKLAWIDYKIETGRI